MYNIQKVYFDSGEYYKDLEVIEEMKNLDKEIHSKKNPE